ncbi:MAG: sulfite exporter TauE/SafE family protein [Acidobacteriota bacterium]
MPPDQLLAALVLSSLVGVALGTFGSGGSILAMPVFVYVARIPPATAVGMSLAVVGATATLGCVVQAREHGIDAHAASVFAVTGVIGAYLGSRLTHLVAPDQLMLIFGGLLLIAGRRMGGPTTATASGARRGLLRPAGIGIVLGGLTGFLGVGGGFLIVPALVLLLGVDTKRAVPTSLAVIAFNALGGLAGQLRHADLDWALTGAFLLAALAGIGVGAGIVRRLSAASLRKVFSLGITLLGAGIVAGHILRLAGIGG